MGSYIIFPDLGRFFSKCWTLTISIFLHSVGFHVVFLAAWDLPALPVVTVVAAFILRFTGAFAGSHSAFACDGDFATFGTLADETFCQVDRRHVFGLPVFP